MHQSEMSRSNKRLPACLQRMSAGLTGGQATMFTFVPGNKHVGGKPSSYLNGTCRFFLPVKWRYYGVTYIRTGAFAQVTLELFVCMKARLLRRVRWRLQWGWCLVVDEGPLPILVQGIGKVDGQRQVVIWLFYPCRETMMHTRNGVVDGILGNSPIIKATPSTRALLEDCHVRGTAEIVKKKALTTLRATVLTC